MRRNFAHWLEFANSEEYCGLGLKDEEILFVSGTTKTTRWAVAAFQGDRFKNKEGSVSGHLGGLASAEFSIQISDHVLPTDHYRTGPVLLQLGGHTDGLSALPDRTEESSASTSGHLEPSKRDQCIFIHYYKVKRRLFHITALRAAAGAHQLPPEFDDSGTSPAIPSNYESCIDQRDTAQKQTLVRMTAYHSIGLTQFLLVLPRSC